MEECKVSIDLNWGKIKMKKSELYKLAQIAVLRDRFLNMEQQLEIVHELMEKEDLALFTEKREAAHGEK